MEQFELGAYLMSVEGVLTPCSFETAQSLMADEDSRIVASTSVSDGFVSTAFLPICLRFEDGSPQAFETVVVRNQKATVVKRYSNLTEALAGHDAYVSDCRLNSPR